MEDNVNNMDHREKHFNKIRFILHNTDNIDSENVIDVFEQCKKCPRCKYILEHAEKLLYNVATVNKLNVLGICEKCGMKKRKDISCNECSRMVKKLMDIKNYKNKEFVRDKRRVNLHQLLNRAIDKNDQSNKVYDVTRSESFLGNICHKGSRQTREPQVAQLFEPKKELPVLKQIQKNQKTKQQGRIRFSKTAQTILCIRKSYSDTGLSNSEIVQLGSKMKVRKQYRSDENIHVIENDDMMYFKRIKEKYIEHPIRIKTNSKESHIMNNHNLLDKNNVHTTNIQNAFYSTKDNEDILQHDDDPDKNTYINKKSPDFATKIDDRTPGKLISVMSDVGTGILKTTREMSPLLPFTPLQKYRSEQNLLSSILADETQKFLHKDFSFFFIKETQMMKKATQNRNSSSELIKDIQEMLRTREEELAKKNEELKRTLQEEEKIKFAREENMRLLEARKIILGDKRDNTQEDNKTFSREVIEKNIIEKIDFSSKKTEKKKKVRKDTKVLSEKSKKSPKVESKIGKNAEMELKKAQKEKEEKLILEKEHKPQEKDVFKKEKEEQLRRIKEEKEKLKREKEEQSKKEKETLKMEKEMKQKEKERQQNMMKEKQRKLEEDKRLKKEKEEQSKKEKEMRQKEKESQQNMTKEKQRKLEEDQRLKKEKEEQSKKEKEMRQKEKERQQNMTEEKQRKLEEDNRDIPKRRELNEKIGHLAEDDAKNENKSKLKTLHEIVIATKSDKPKPEKKAEELNSKDIDINKIKLRKPSPDDLILQLVKLKQSEPDKPSQRPKHLSQINISLNVIAKHMDHKSQKLSTCIICKDSELELDIENILNKSESSEIADIIIGQKICKYKPLLGRKAEKKQTIPILFASTFKEDFINKNIVENLPEQSERTPPLLPGKYTEQEVPKGVIRYALSDRTFIDKGWTMLPTEKVVRKMNVYRMRPAHPEFDWFEHNKSKKIMYYDSGEKLAEFDDNGRVRWYYRSGRIALEYYDAEEINAQQRFVIYSSGEPDKRGFLRPLAILATFDYLGNGIVFDHRGKTRLKYNQTEGVVLDRSIGPVSHWKWHSLNDPPVLQQVMIDTQMAQKDSDILKLSGPADNKTRPDNEEMLAIEFENFIKEKSKKLSQKFKPFQIKMKALKINERFSLKVLDQATIYLIFRDGSTNLKLNIGMILDHQEIVDTDIADVGEVSNSLERFPARTDSLAGLQRSVAYAQRVERNRVEHERRIRPTQPTSSLDKLITAISRPLRAPLRTVPSDSSSATCDRRKPSSINLYYDTRFV